MTKIIEMIVNFFTNIYDFVVKIFELIPTLISFIPNPFRTITLSFVSIMLIVYLWKLYKGGS